MIILFGYWSNNTSGLTFKPMGCTKHSFLARLLNGPMGLYILKWPIQCNIFTAKWCIYAQMGWSYPWLSNLYMEMGLSIFPTINGPGFNKMWFDCNPSRYVGTMGLHMVPLFCGCWLIALSHSPWTSLMFWQELVSLLKPFWRTCQFIYIIRLKIEWFTQNNHEFHMSVKTVLVHMSVRTVLVRMFAGVRSFCIFTFLF